MTFILVTPINPAICPVCGEAVERIWHLSVARGVTKVVACESCADPEHEEADVKHAA